MNTINNDKGIYRQLFQILTRASLESLNKGDILRGRVQSMENGLLLIKLMDGSSFTASAPDGFYANAGDPIALEIGERINDQLTARILSSESDIRYEGKPVDSGVLAHIRQSLVSYGVSASEKLISNVLDILKAEHDIPVSQASFLAANRLSNEPEIAGIARKIAEHEFQLHDNLLSLNHGLQKAVAEMEPSIRSSLLSPIIIEQKTDRLMERLDKIFSGVPRESNHPVLQNIKGILTKTLLEELSGRVNSDLPETLDLNALEGLIKNAVSSLKEGADSGRNEELNQENIRTDMPFNAREMNSILKAVNKALSDIHSKTGKMYQKDTEETVLKGVREALNRLFDKAVVKADKDMPEYTGIRDRIKALKDIMEFTQKALNHMDNNHREAILPSFKEIDNAFRFFSQISAYDSVLQLPVRINKKDTTCELYIMKRKNGRKKLDAGNFTLLLSLHTQGLGYIESFLNASNKYVTISFRVEREELVRLVKDNYRILYDGLLKKGFTLVDMKCRILEDGKTSILDAAQKAGRVLGIQSKVDLKI